MGSVGTRLREARESRGLSIDQVEEQTRIRRAFILALEEDRFDALPGPVYARGFLRTYASFLGLSAEDVLAQSQAEAGLAPALHTIPTVLDEPLTIGAPRAAFLPTFFVAVMATLVVLVGGWYGYARYYLKEDPLLLLEERGILPAGLIVRAAEETPTAPAAGAPTSRASAVAGVVTAETPAAAQEEPTAPLTAPPTPTASTTPTRAGVATPTPRRTLTPTPTPTATLPPPEAGQTPLAIPGQVVVQARATADCWVSVTADGREVLSRTLATGEEQTWQAQESISLRIGNAGGLSLTVNGEALGTLGASGEVVNRTFVRQGAN